MSPFTCQEQMIDRSVLLLDELYKIENLPEK